METPIVDKELILYTLAMGFALKVIVFTLGFFTIKMGHSLIRDGVKGSFTFSTEAKGMKGALQSSSPGLLFVLLGVFLIGYAIYLDRGIDIKEEFGPDAVNAYSVDSGDKTEDKSDHSIKMPTLHIDTTRNFTKDKP